MKRLIYWDVDDWLSLLARMFLAGCSVIIFLLAVLAAVNLVKLIAGCL